ncbi:MAG TPA: CDP-archaeol synthase, partial [Pirellulales bacterium]|nr:CDP-archaeol synthase [Pirellulales bacterium]
QPGGVTQRIAYATLPMAYVGVLLAFVVLLRLRSLASLLALIVVVKLCDIGAYTVGRLVGRHKMTPVLSPGKTWEGALGGIVFGCLGAWLALVVLGPRISDMTAPSVSTWLRYGIIVSIAGILGDLAESLLKRDLGHKDSSPWMPGFGGVLDIIDSILLATPVAYALGP